MMKPKVPRVASVAFNIKGADLLFLDHQDVSELTEHDEKMWGAAHVDITQRPFGQVIVYVPMADDGLNLNTLRTNRATDRDGYSYTRPFALGIQDLWPYLHLFFDNRSTAAGNLLAEIERYFEETSGEHFTLATVLNLFETQINLPQKDRKNGRWEDFPLGVVRAVRQRLRTLPSTLGGLIDVTGTGFGLEQLTDLKPYDVVVIDFERIMANPRDPEVAENAIKIITAYVLNRLTEAMTQGIVDVDHVIVFADELNRLAPRHGDGGIGEYLAQLARTTRDRGIVLFGAGQFRSGINEDILKAASVHYSMQTPDYELGDRIYSTLSAEIKARLTKLRTGEMLVQYPSLRTAVFARFPRPFVLSGASKWRELFPVADPLPVADCIYERLRRLDPQHPPQNDEVRQLLSRLPGWDEPKPNKRHAEVVEVLRSVEMKRSLAKYQQSDTPWEEFRRLVQEKFDRMGGDATNNSPIITPPGFVNDEEGW
jgi:uncharacterized protein